jgi:hypothetical protein
LPTPISDGAALCSRLKSWTDAKIVITEEQAVVVAGYVTAMQLRKGKVHTQTRKPLVF